MDHSGIWDDDDDLQVLTESQDFSEPSRFALTLSLKLSKTDKLRQPDIFCKIHCYLKHENEQEEFIGATEVCFNNAKFDHIFFSQKILLDVHPQKLKNNIIFYIEPLESHVEVGNKSKNEMASVSTAIEHIISNFKKTSFEIGSSHSTLNIQCNEVPLQDQILKISFSASHISNKGGVLGSTNPFIVIYTDENDKNEPCAPVFVSEYCEGISDPVWPHYDIELSQLCYGNVRQRLRIEAWHYNSHSFGEVGFHLSSPFFTNFSTNHRFIGLFHASVDELILSLEDGKTFELVNPLKLGVKKNYVNSGYFKIESLKICPKLKLSDLFDNVTENDTIQNKLIRNEEHARFSKQLRLKLALVVDFSAKTTTLHPNVHKQTSTDQDSACMKALTDVCKYIYDLADDNQIECYSSGSTPGKPALIPLLTDGPALITEFDNVITAYKTRVQKNVYTGGLRLEEVIKECGILASSATLNNNIQGSSNAPRDAVAQKQKNASEIDRLEFLVVLILSQSYQGSLTSPSSTLVHEIQKCSKLPICFIHIGVGQGGNFSPYFEAGCGLSTVYPKSHESSKTNNVSQRLRNHLYKFLTYENHFDSHRASISRQAIKEHVIEQVLAFVSSESK